MPINCSLPIESPVLIFAIILIVILFVPIAFNKIKLPAIIGLIIAGMIIGPKGFNLIARNESIELFGTVGLLYIMFLAGLEIDLTEFKKNKYKSLVFGAYTFFIPMFFGPIIFNILFDYTISTSILVASMFASHTLITYPIIAKFGITKNISVNISIGGTLVANMAALIILAIIVGSHAGKLDTTFWIKLILSTTAFAATVLLAFPAISRWFFKIEQDNVLQYIYVLAVVYAASFLAILAGLEAIIGAFLAGFALNRLIPQTSPLMNRIDFVGNALFIPFFLIGVGMLVDYRSLFGNIHTIIIALTMSAIATGSKYLAADLTQRTYNMSDAQKNIIFGLSNAQAASTLAAVLIGYKIITGQTDSGEPIRLLDENILNGTVVMILVTCTIASFVTQKAALKIAKDDLKANPLQDISNTENTLVGLANESTVECLIQLTLSTIDRKKCNQIDGLHIITADKENSGNVIKAKKLIEKAEKYAASVDFFLRGITRYDVSISAGIINTIKENNIRHFYIGLHEKSSLDDTFFGNLTQELLNKNDSAIYIYKNYQPLGTIKKYVLLIPAKAELEDGFKEWFNRMTQIAVNTGNRFEICAHDHTIEYLKMQKSRKLNLVYKKFNNMEDFLVIARDVVDDTMLIVNLARKNAISYQPVMEKISSYLGKYFKRTSFIVVYANNFNKSTNTNEEPTNKENPNNQKSRRGLNFKR